VTQERDASLEPGDVAAVSVRLRPKPLAFVQFTDWEGSFSGRAVVGWSAPGEKSTCVCRWLSIVSSFVDLIIFFVECCTL
jgi:hypothetical protein